MKPTVIGSLASSAQDRAIREIQDEAVIGAKETLPQPGKFPVALSDAQLAVMRQRLSEMDFMAMSDMDISTLGDNEEVALHKTLDGFLAKMDHLHNPRLFELFNRIKEGVEQERLPALADTILQDKQSIVARVTGMLKNKNKKQQMLQDARDMIARRVAQTTKTLVDLLDDMERQLRSEMQRLATELIGMEQIKYAYRERFDDFVVVTALAHAFWCRARAQVDEFVIDNK